MIRQGTTADLPQITNVRTSVRENHLSVEQMAERGITTASIAGQLLAGELRCWVAEANGVVVGFSMAHSCTANVFALFVLPGHEGCGYGTALLNECEAWLRDLGLKEANLSTGLNSRARGFYRRRNWREAGEKSGDEVLMQKAL